MSNTYSQSNQIHALSQTVNAAFGMDFPSVADMQTYVQAVVSTVLTDDQGTATATNNYLGSAAAGTQWDCIWGPYVWTNNPNTNKIICDNTVALFYNSSQKLFVVGIAGTNSNSMYDWMTEDFDVSTTQPWNTVSAVTNAPATAVLSTGTYNGINNLLNNIKDNNGYNVVTALQNYLTTLGASAGAQTLAVCGHSLGGALTPVMALYLFENASTWNSNSLVNAVAAYPTAGPTPGDINFATYYENLVTNNPTPNPISFTYTHIFNSIDVVPQAWELDTMSNVPFIYDADYTSLGTPPDAIIAGMVSGALCSSFNTSGYIPKSNNYTHIQTRTAFNGSYQAGKSVAGTNPELIKIYDAINMGIAGIFFINSTLRKSQLNGNTSTGDNGTVYPNFLIDFGNFVLQMVYQHTIAYNSNSLIEIQAYVTEYQGIKANIPGGNTSEFQTPEGRLASRLIGSKLGLKNLTNLANAGKAALETVSEVA